MSHIKVVLCYIFDNLVIEFNENAHLLILTLFGKSSLFYPHGNLHLLGFNDILYIGIFSCVEKIKLYLSEQK